MDILNRREGKGGMVFYQAFLLSLLQCTIYSIKLNCRNRKRLREFEEREISRQSCRGYCKEQGGLKTFVWISSKNSASAYRIPWGGGVVAKGRAGGVGGVTPE